MVLLFATLAAITPIAGSMFVATTALARHRSRVFERTVRRRHASEVEGRMLRMNEIYAPKEGQTRAERDELIASAKAADDAMDARHDDELNRLGYTLAPVWTEVGVAVAMSGTPLATGEYRDQWVLIGSSTAGVTFLALSWILSF